jgi:AraC-like DNA-binding protein
MEPLSIASNFARNMIEGAKIKGYNIKQLLEFYNISPNIINDKNGRISFEQHAMLSNLLSSTLNDENYGLTTNPQPRGTYKIACYCAIHEDSIERVLRTFTECLNLMRLDMIHEVSQSQDLIRYSITSRPGTRTLNNYIAEHTLLVVHRTLCWMTNERIPLTRVDLKHSEPAYSKEYTYVFHRAPVFFNQPRDALYFHQSILRMQNVRTFPQLKAFLRQAPMTLLSQGVQAEYLSSMIHSWLENQLSRHHKMPTIEAAAERFKLHPQALKTKLRLAGTSYQTIKTKVRKEQALRLIASAKYNVEEIADQVGFSEPSAFIRVFKSWTGLTPLTYRKKLIKQAMSTI